ILSADIALCHSGRGMAGLAQGSEEARLAAGQIAAKVFIGALGGDTASRRAVNHADLHQVGLVHFLDGVLFLAERGSERANANRAASVLIQQREHQVAVHFIEAIFIHAKHFQRLLRDGLCDAAIGADFGEVARAAEQPVGDARRSAAAAGDFLAAGLIHFDIQDLRRTANDDKQIFRLIKIEPMNDAESRAKRRGDEASARGGADQREMAERKRMNTRTGPLADDEIDAKILNGRIENFLDGRLHAVNLIQEEQFPRFKGSQDGGEIAFAFEKRTSAGLDRNVQFVGDDLRERGFAKTGRTIEQNVVEGFAAAARRLDSDGDIFLYALLPDIFFEAFWADAGVEPRVLVAGGAGDNAVSFVFVGSVGHAFCAGLGHLTFASPYFTVLLAGKAGRQKDRPLQNQRALRRLSPVPSAR